LPEVVTPEQRRLAEALRAEVDDGDGAAHALVDHLLPDSAAIYYLANRPGRVHIDSLGSNCPVLLLGQQQLPGCSTPAWVGSVRLVVAYGTRAQRHLERKRWQRTERIGQWTVFRRGERGESLVAPQ
jgi:hypothetical protein